MMIRRWNHFLSINENNTMENKEIAQHVKLGAFVLVGVILFLIAVFFIGSENNIFSRTFTLSAVFKNVEGLKEGDNVWLSGVKIGTVKRVRIISEGKVVVDFSLRDNQHDFIYTDATASIGSDGLVGSKIVVLRPGSNGQVVAENDTIHSVSPTDTQDLINIAKDVGENTRSLTSDLSQIAKKINSGYGVVGELLADQGIADELRHVVANLRTTGNNTARASAELHTLLNEMRSGNGLLPTLISDTTYVKTFDHALASIQQVTANAETASQDLREISSRINDPNSALGVLMSDSTVADQLKQTFENAEQASHKLDENMEALQHNFLFRGYFRKQEKKRQKEQERRQRTAEPATAKRN